MNLRFPEEFYQEETREGFTIPAKMKQCWAVQLEILTYVDEICDRHGLKWWADYGTLLGAVRHGGYIPWDDDIDICMLRPDYQRLLAVLPFELPSQCKAWSIGIQKGEYCTLSTLVACREQIDAGLDAREAEITAYYDGCPYVSGVDIYPLDYVPRDEQERSTLFEIFHLVYFAAEQYDNPSARRQQEVADTITVIEGALGRKIPGGDAQKPALWQLADDLSRMYTAEESDTVIWTPEIATYTADRRRPLDAYRETVMLPFEMFSIPAPADYDAILRTEYGDYQKPVQHGADHTYPFYAEQDRRIEEARKGRQVLWRPDAQQEAREPLAPVGILTGGGPQSSDATEAAGIPPAPGAAKPAGTGRKEVVFLPYKASMWDALESVWRAMDADPEIDAYVVPIPYYDKDAEGNFTQMHYEGDQYPEDVLITDYRTFDLAAHHPSAIYIHNPYDAYNHITSIHPDYYSDKLREYTDELVYIPYFILGKVNPENEKTVEFISDFACTAGVINADRVIVQSEEMRQAYINALVKYAGEETRPVWEKKIEGTGSPKVDKILATKREDQEIPEEWRTLITRPDGSAKKIILYNTGVTALLKHEEKMLDKIRRALEIFRENREDVTLLWRPHPLIEATLTSMRPEMWEGYREIRDAYVSEAWGIYDDTADLDRAIVLADAYYGDPSSVVWLFRETGKPIMIQNPEV